MERFSNTASSWTNHVAGCCEDRLRARFVFPAGRGCDLDRFQIAPGAITLNRSNQSLLKEAEDMWTRCQFDRARI